MNLKQIEKMNGVPIEFIQNVNIKANEVTAKGNGYKFYNDIYKVWCELNYRIPKCKEDVLTQSPWYNSDVKVNGKVLVQTKQNMIKIASIKILYNESRNT